LHAASDQILEVGTGGNEAKLHLGLDLLSEVGTTNDGCTVLLAGQAQIGQWTGNYDIWEEVLPQLEKCGVCSCLE